jgi:hypothetical protein
MASGTTSGHPPGSDPARRNGASPTRSHTPRFRSSVSMFIHYFARSPTLEAARDPQDVTLTIDGDAQRHLGRGVRVLPSRTEHDRVDQRKRIDPADSSDRGESPDRKDSAMPSSVAQGASYKEAPLLRVDQTRRQWAGVRGQAASIAVGVSPSCRMIHHPGPWIRRQARSMAALRITGSPAGDRSSSAGFCSNGSGGRDSSAGRSHQVRSDRHRRGYLRRSLAAPCVTRVGHVSSPSKGIRPNRASSPAMCSTRCTRPER